ncbi:hypothetical protein AB0442_29630 [Kitasatospora sp. NPDC085895]|uniref:hypothetical protein n=1 Tax=Kitasatospora sp. NPDC085895 TaxID=3155057 RepID=UPI003450B7BA
MTAVAVPAAASRSRVGMSDVQRLRARLDALMALDDQLGGHAALETAALAGARMARQLQQLPATDRVRRALFSVAADYTATAAWSCIDAREGTRAQQHLDRALALAGLAQDSTAQLRLWNSHAMLAYQRTDYTTAVAAGHAAHACAVTRTDPLTASLAHARTAIGHAAAGSRQAALRSLGHAGEALTRAHTQPRPSWLAFYGPAELAAITAITHQHLGQHDIAEWAAHRALAGIPEQFRRNRASATVRLALAQLHQGDTEQACATATGAYTLVGTDPIPARLRTLLGDFHRSLLTLAPRSAQTRQWTDRVISERTRPQ